MATLKTKIKIRRDTAANLANVVLEVSEPAYATDTKKFAIGDGSTKFSELKDYGFESDTLQTVTNRGTTTTKSITTAGLTTTSGPINITGVSGFSEGIRLHSVGNLSSIWWNATTDKEYCTNGMWGITAYDYSFSDSAKRNTFRFRGPTSATATSPTDQMWINATGLVAARGGFEHGGLTAPSGKTKNDYILLAGGGTKAISDFATSDVGDDYLPLAGGTMTGAIERVYDAASNDPMLKIASNNVDTRIFRVYDKGAGWGDTGRYGFNLTYNGTGGGVDNSLTLYADNQNAATQVIGWQLNQAGQMGIGTSANASYRLNVGGTINATGTIYAADGVVLNNNKYLQAKSKSGTAWNLLTVDGSDNVIFGDASMSTNTYIAVKRTMRPSATLGTGVSGIDLGANVSGGMFKNIYGETLYENGTSLANKYLGKTAKAADSDKLDGQDGTYYLDYNNFTNTPTIPSTTNFVTGPSSSTGNAVARFHSTTGKIIKNSGVTIDESNNISTAGSLKLTNNGDVLWNSGSWWQRIKITDDSNANTNVFEFQQSSDSGANWTSLFTILDNGSVKAKKFVTDGSSNQYVVLGDGTTKALSDFTMDSDLSSYMPKSGGQFTGPISFKDGTALPSKTLQYIIGLDPFDDGGQVGWQSKANFLSGYVTGSSLTADTIILGGGSSAVKTSSKKISTSVGTDDTTVPTSKAVKDYVTGLGYITSDTKVTNTLNTTTKYYVTGTTSATTNTGTQIFDTAVYVNTTAGALHATTYNMNTDATMKYDSTTQCIRFVIN